MQIASNQRFCNNTTSKTWFREPSDSNPLNFIVAKCSLTLAKVKLANSKTHRKKCTMHFRIISWSSEERGSAYFPGGRLTILVPISEFWWVYSRQGSLLPCLASPTNNKTKSSIDQTTTILRPFSKTSSTTTRIDSIPSYSSTVFDPLYQSRIAFQEIK